MIGFAFGVLAGIVITAGIALVLVMIYGAKMFER